MPGAALAAAVAAARTELDRFHADLLPIIARLVAAPALATRIAARLIEPGS